MGAHLETRGTASDNDFFPLEQSIVNKKSNESTEWTKLAYKAHIRHSLKKLST